jgi:hypothetical protein
MLQSVIEANSIPEPNSGCWLWLRKAPGGYGYCKINGKAVPATHVALMCTGIEVKAGMVACHTCDNTYCVNPDHLFVGTQSDNVLDAVKKGRWVGYGKRTTCKRGHPLSGENLYVDPKYAKHHCRTCRKMWGVIQDAKRRDRKRNYANC